MYETLKDAQQRATRSAIKEERARDAALAMKEYMAEKRAELAKTERLRALRLARERQDSQRKTATTATATAPTKRAKGKR